MVFEVLLFIVFGFLIFIEITHWMTYLVVKYSNRAKIERQIIDYLCKEYLSSFDKSENDNNIGYE